MRQNLGKHIDDIAEKYLITGETQDVALMFIPSESVYAELHDAFDDVVQRGYRAGVIIVSPSLLMLAIQVVQQIQKDARMREAADQIRNEVALMIEDVSGSRTASRISTSTSAPSTRTSSRSSRRPKKSRTAERRSRILISAKTRQPHNHPAPMTRKLEAGE